MRRQVLLLILLLALTNLAACQPAKFGGWEQLPGPSAANVGENSLPYVEALTGRSPEDLWGATAMGTVTRWDGASWGVIDRVSYPTTKLATVGNALWVVAGGKALRWGSSGFEGLPGLSLASDQRVENVWGLSPNDVWVQWRGLETLGVLRWDGSRWDARPEPYIPQWGAAADDAWAVHDGSLVHWNGSSWRDERTEGVRAVWGLSSAQVWAVGRYETLMGWNGAKWVVLSTRGKCDYHDCATFKGVWATGPSDVWVVGENGPGWGGSAYGAISHWDGKGFTPQMKYAKDPSQWNETTDVGPLRDVFGFATGEVFATDGHQLLRLGN